jgi:hypothetical protein
MKTLKPGSRPFIALGTICGLLFLVPLYLGFGTGKWTDAGKMAGTTLIILAFLLGPIVFARLEIDEEEIRLWNLGRLRKRVRFEEIGHSSMRILGEKDWPVSLTIVGKDGESELMSVGLKIFRKEDVVWLLALPELKITR